MRKKLALLVFALAAAVAAVRSVPVAAQTCSFNCPPKSHPFCCPSGAHFCCPDNAFCACLR